MQGYKHLSYDERTKLAILRKSGVSVANIAKELGRPKNTIYNELNRNEAPPGEYWPDTAQELMLSRRQKECILDHDEALRDFVLTQLQCHYWTPEQISGYLKNRQSELPYVCHETIYSWIYHPKQKGEKLWRYLPRHKAKRGMRKSRGAGVSRIPNRVSIQERPKSVESRKSFGHWEGDLMSFVKNSQFMLVLKERKTRFILSTPLPSKRADDTADNMIKLLKQLPSKALKTLTFDNGGEFARHSKVSALLNVDAYFCDAYASWQKGGVENANGRLRRDLPRKTRLNMLPKEDFDETIENYNMTPRKCLGWLTPLEAFNKNLKRV